MALSALLKKLFKFVKEVLKLAEATEENRSDILETQAQLTKLSEQVRRLAYEIRRINEREEEEKEKAALRMENLKLEIKQQILEAQLEERDAWKDNERKKLTE